MKKKGEYEYLVSACLCGFPCRYDGKSRSVPEAERLYKEGKAVPFCPEVEGGLPTPRTPCEICADKVISAFGEDRTAEYRRGAEIALEICKKYGIKKALLKQNSPSCGTKHIYDGSFSGRLTEGMGVTARLLFENGIDVIGEK